VEKKELARRGADKEIPVGRGVMEKKELD